MNNQNIEKYSNKIESYFRELLTPTTPKCNVDYFLSRFILFLLIRHENYGDELLTAYGKAHSRIRNSELKSIFDQCFQDTFKIFTQEDLEINSKYYRNFSNTYFDEKIFGD